MLIEENFKYNHNCISFDIMVKQFCFDERVDNWKRVKDLSKPFFLKKKTRAGFTYTSTGYSTIMDEPLLIVEPNKKILKRTQNDIGEAMVILGSNREICTKAKQTNMPFVTKPTKCMIRPDFWLCDHGRHDVCPYSQIVDALVAGEVKVLGITYQKLITIYKSPIWDLVKNYFRYIILDECSELIWNSHPCFSREWLIETGYEEVDEIVNILKSAKKGEQIVTNNFNDIWYDLYKLEEATQARPVVGRLLTLLKNGRFRIMNNGSIISYIDQTETLMCLKDVWDKLIFSEAEMRYQMLFDYLDQEIRIESWVKTIMCNKHFIFVDRKKPSRENVLKYYNKLEELGLTPLLVAMNKRQASYFLDSVNATYYRSDFCKGIGARTRCLLMTGLPYPPNDAEKYDDNMLLTLSQTADRVKDGDNKIWSFVFIMGTKPEEVEEFYSGEGLIIDLGRQTFERHIEIVLALVKDERIRLEDKVDIARAINVNTNPANVLTSLNKRHLLSQYKSVIMEYRKANRKRRLDKI